MLSPPLQPPLQPPSTHPPRLLRTEADVLEYLRTLDASALPLSIGSAGPFAVEVVEITDGNLNFAFHAFERESPARAVFVKQAPGFIKCLGEAYALSSCRALLEGAALSVFGELAPDHVPRLLHLDATNRVMVLEMLHGHVLQRAALGRSEWHESSWFKGAKPL